MSRQCREYDRLRALGEDSAEWAAHRERCADCRAQQAAERRLEALFDGVPRPALSAGFDRRLEQRLAPEPARPAGARRRSLVMRAYWLAALAASCFVLATLDWPDRMATGPGLAALVLTGLAFCAPAVYLARRFGLDVFELISLTAE